MAMSKLSAFRNHLRLLRRAQIELFLMRCSLKEFRVVWHRMACSLGNERYAQQKAQGLLHRGQSCWVLRSNRNRFVSESSTAHRLQVNSKTI